MPDRPVRTSDEDLRLLTHVRHPVIIAQLATELLADRARLAELEEAAAAARRIHDESPGECYHCPSCQDAARATSDPIGTALDDVTLHRLYTNPEADPLTRAVAVELWNARETAVATQRRIAELELDGRTPVGYLVAHRDALAQWWAQESLWPDRARAEADMQEIANDVPGADWRVLACFDDSGAPYRAGRRDA